MTVSALYSGRVYHCRLQPKRHAFRYRVFMMLFDLDELDTLHRTSRIFSHNRSNILSFYDADHLDSALPLRRQIELHLSAANLPTGGAIRVLCMPRVFGYVFNPLSVFFCHAPDGALAAMFYEVNNTFGQRHSYLVPVEADTLSEGRLTQTCDKEFYVSPFMDMAMTYRFRVDEPGPAVHIGVDAIAEGTPMITTHFEGRRLAWSDRALLGALLRFPLLTLKVVAAIHWEALFIWAKGIKLRPKPPAPTAAVTTVGRDHAG